MPPFTKNDPRINRKGRPKSFDAWRNMLIAIANEPAVQRDKDNRVKKLVLIQVPLVKDGAPVFDEETGEPVFIDHYATNAEVMARQMMSDPKYKKDFVEGAFGKVPQEVDVTSGGEKINSAELYESILSKLARIADTRNASAIPEQPDTK